MKKILKNVLSVVLLVLLGVLFTSCNNASTVNNTQKNEVAANVENKELLSEVRGVTVPKFSLNINEKNITNEDLAEFPIYKAQVTSTNSSGTTTTVNYIGFKFVDALSKAGLANNQVYIEAIADDGYSVKYENYDINNMLIAISRDGNQFKTSPWFCPCDSQTTGDFLQGLVTVLVNTENKKPDVNAKKSDNKSDAKEEKTELSKPDKLDRTDKVQFEKFSFKVAGRDITNEDLDGVKIYKITCDALNSKDNIITATYTGYVLKDVLDKLAINEYNKVTVVANDGYKAELSNEEINSEYSLIAIEKDKSLGEDGTVWFAPCESDKTKKYMSKVVEFSVE